MANLAVYIRIHNESKAELKLIDKYTTHGYWEVDPPARVMPSSKTEQFEIKDHSGAAAGSEGSFTYLAYDKRIQECKFQARFCDSWSANNNYVYFSSSLEPSFTTSFIATINDVPHKNYCPESGHPIYLDLFIRDFP